MKCANSWLGCTTLVTQMKRFAWTFIAAALLLLSKMRPFSQWLEMFLSGPDFGREHGAGTSFDRGKAESPLSRHPAEIVPDSIAQRPL